MGLDAARHGQSTQGTPSGISHSSSTPIGANGSNNSSLCFCLTQDEAPPVEVYEGIQTVLPVSKLQTIIPLKARQSQCWWEHEPHVLEGAPSDHLLFESQFGVVFGLGCWLFNKR